MAAGAYKIISPDGTKVDLVHPDCVELALEQWNGRRELDVDGQPIGGEYVAVEAEPGKGWGV